MLSHEDNQFLRRAIRVAMNGRGWVEPNPMVGCVLVKDGQIIGEGFHGKFGGPHAEPTALADCNSRGNDPAGATAYVTLEPCCHLNKKTPPCAPRLIEARVSRVVIGCLDPNPDVDGKGVAMLTHAGIPVDRADEQIESEAKQLLGAFGQSLKENYFTLKWAQSANGKVAGRNGEPVQISNARSSRIVHELRSRSDAIVVGIGTVITDDPRLTARDVPPIRTPQRIVLDSSLRIPEHSRLLTDREGGQVWIVCSNETYRERGRDFELRHRVLVCESDGDFRTTPPFWEKTHILVEPGPTLARSMLPWADRLWVIRSPMKIDGGPSAPSAAAIPDHYVVTGELQIDGDVLTEYLNTKSPVFFAAVPSADFVLAEASVASAEIARLT